jgi:hypothetical protein
MSLLDADVISFVNGIEGKLDVWLNKKGFVLDSGDEWS